jgi:glycosyl hydrolase family 113
MRALHMEGNWGGNQHGIKWAVSGMFDLAQPLSSTTVSTSVNRSSFVDSFGVLHVNDVAQVKLTGITLGGGAIAEGGFWVVRNVLTSAINVQFRPSLDSSLADICCFSGDLSFNFSVGATYIDQTPMSLATGTASTYVASVANTGAALVQSGSFSIAPPAAFDQASIVAALTAFQSAVGGTKDEYFRFLKSENANWLGVSVAIFNDSIADPTVKVKYRPAGNTSGDIFTYDDNDLTAFVTRARQQGFHVYLTLAFEPAGAGNAPDLGDPTCQTPQYKPNRAFLGEGSVITGDPLQVCINPAYWWWNPSHPDHAANVTQFWTTYTQVAVKYATICQQVGVEMFSLGTETERLFRTRPSNTWLNDFHTQLGQLVSAVRAVYSGRVTYDQQSEVLAHPQFFDGGAGSRDLFADLDLDVVGVSAYFGIVQAPPATVLPPAQLDAAWDAVFQTYLIPLQQRNPGKPIVFLEFGYTDSVGAPAFFASQQDQPEPPRDAENSTPGMEQQKRIFEAFFRVDDRYSDMVHGAFIWGNQSYVANEFYLCSIIYFNLYCKTSAPAVATIYGDWMARDTPFSDNPLVTGVTTIRRVHITELRAKIDALRRRVGLSGYSWSDPALTAGTTLIHSQHVFDLRAALLDVYAAMSLPPPSFAAAVGVGTAVTAAAVEELRAAVTSIE